MKRLGILAAVFVLLALLLVWQRYQRREIVTAGPAETIQLDPETVTRVQIHTKDGNVELERAGSEWKLVQPIEYPANTDLVNTMLKAVGDLKLEDIISTNPENRSTYQVDSTGTTVDVWTGDKKALALVVGKSTSDWTHTFVRRADGDDVYRADGVLTYQFNRRPDDWRDKTIFKADEKDIHSIVLSYPKDHREFAIVRTDSTHWGVRNPSGSTQPGDSLTIARTVGAAGRLMTVNFATPEEASAADFSQPDFRLAVEAGGTTTGVSFVAVDESKMLAKKDGNDTVFSIYKSNLGNLMKDEQELLTGKKKEETTAAAKPKKQTAAAAGNKTKK
jgi:Domain of unknown function (DUF4340)